jgi:diguanylate cyclase (GGDEF)-like protein
MYSAEDLSAYPFFREVLKASSLPTIHDSLTGLIARPFMLRFVQSLIQDRKPFTLMIVDLDNFKNINDNYGHRAGDEMLAAVAEELRRVIGKDGIVGRYGGDEFLITYFGHTDYDGVHGFLDELYNGASKVFRKNMRISD